MSPSPALRPAGAPARAGISCTEAGSQCPGRRRDSFLFLFRAVRAPPRLGTSLSRGAPRRLARSSHAIDWASDDTTCLNEL
eukprot:7135537-Pyramimonas_sp.AAC.1